MAAIDNLIEKIGHKRPMLMLDDAWIQSSGIVKGRRYVAADHPMVRQGRLIGTALLEMLCQTAACGVAAGISPQADSPALPGGRLAQLRDVEFSGNLQVPLEIEFTIEEVLTLQGKSLCIGTARAAGDVVCHGRFYLSNGR